MLHVELENILGEDDAVRRARELIDLVDKTKQLVVVTRQNRPAVAMIDIDQLEKLTGRTVTPVAPLPSSHPAAEEPFATTPAAMPAPMLNELPDLPLPPLENPPFSTPPTPLEAPAPAALPNMPDLPDFSAPVTSSSPLPEMPAPIQAPMTAAPVTPPSAPAPVAQAPIGTPPLQHLLQTPEALPPEDLNSSSPLA